MQKTKDLKNEYQRHVNFAIREKDSGILVGSCGFDDSDLKSPTEVGIGYWIGKKHWSKGIGTAIVNSLVHIGMEIYGYAKLYACVFEWNLGSQKVLLKNGFTKEKLIENYIEKYGKFINALKFSQSKKD
ncbi:acyl-CoA N-acyltransferase [Piromyces finnis]|uniref:Acyl-CoA N-acyltransferase n=1 Tax=Piromyces finnis TaxID=1754191 RepID=A0A1Y1UV44_9FUNG|nr:acyl-CoA N-acyltransferase [Piromyces finnis]|eukprot:ORX41899.1 acyl-CoA N-acyltransferase [Piromyces finnis]